MTRRLRFCTIILLAAAASWLSSHAYAVTTNWIADSGLFTTAANWDNGVPDSGDTAIFNRGFVGYTVTFPGGTIFEPPVNYAITYLRVNNNHVNFVWDSSFPLQASPTLSVLASGVSIVVGENAGEVGILGTTLAGFSGANTSIGRAPGASGTLNVVGGTFSMSGNIDVGDSGTGTLNITNGGRVENLTGFIGHFANSEGQVTVSGANSTWASNALTVSRGQLHVNDGGVVSVTNRLEVYGRLTGNGRVQGYVLNYGEIWPGNSPANPVGTLHIDGDYEQFQSELFIELAADDNYDKLDIDGNIALDGGLYVSLLPGYSPQAGDMFDILDWTGTLQGTFSEITLPFPSAGLKWNTSQLYTSGILSVERANFFTYPQEIWGEPGTAASTVLTNNFDTVYPATGVLEVGIPGAGGFSMAFTGANPVFDYLPSVGTSGQLTADLVDPTTSASGAFGGEVVSLQLNVDFSDAGVTLGALGIPFGDLVIHDNVDVPQVNGRTVRQFLVDVNTLLGGGAVGYSVNGGYRLAVDLNASFIEGQPSLFAQDHLRIPGDFNGDRKVDAADYVVWRKSDGTPAGYNEWRANFGRTGASGATAGLTSSANAAVPEPACAALVCLAMAGLWMVVRSRLHRQ